MLKPPVVVLRPESLPINVLSFEVRISPVAVPTNVFLLPVELDPPAYWPRNVLFAPVVFAFPA